MGDEGRVRRNADLSSCDYVLVTHDHSDHASDVVDVAFLHHYLGL